MGSSSRPSGDGRRYTGHSVGASNYSAASRTPVVGSSKANSIGYQRTPSQPFERYKEVVKRSYLADEFTIKNPVLNQSCFLNVALQTLWVFPSVRMNLITFCDQREGGPAELKKLINAIQDFFAEIIQKSQEDSILRRLHSFESTNIRRELFKLKYQRAEYMLNYEADAFEVFDFLLTCIHTWS